MRRPRIECAGGAKYLRPIMFNSGRAQDADHETLTPEKVKKIVIEDFSIPANGKLPIATGAV